MSIYQNRLSCQPCTSGNCAPTKPVENTGYKKDCANTNIKEIQISEDKVIVFYKDCTYDILEPSVLKNKIDPLKELETLADKVKSNSDTLVQLQEKIAEKASQEELTKLTNAIEPVGEFNGDVSFYAIGKSYKEQA